MARNDESNQMYYVKFTKSCSPYTTGEVGYFNHKDAYKLKSIGVCIFVKREEDDTFTPIPEEGDENATDEQADVNAKDGTDGDGDAGEGEGEDEGAEGKTGTKSKKGRVKL